MLVQSYKTANKGQQFGKQIWSKRKYKMHFQPKAEANKKDNAHGPNF